MKGKVVEEFGVYSFEVSWCGKVGIRSRSQKATELSNEDKSYQQVVVKRERNS